MSFEDRKAIVENNLSLDEITLREGVCYWYWWVRAEFAHLCALRAQRRRNKFAEKMEAFEAVLEFRHEMKEM